ncbi:hypothetical protein SHIRM173S_00605 [Streptomyces hirsutus]
MGRDGGRRAAPPYDADDPGWPRTRSAQVQDLLDMTTHPPRTAPAPREPATHRPRPTDPQRPDPPRPPAGPPRPAQSSRPPPARNRPDDSHIPVPAQPLPPGGPRQGRRGGHRRRRRQARVPATGCPGSANSPPDRDRRATLCGRRCARCRRSGSRTCGRATARTSPARTPRSRWRHRFRRGLHREATALEFLAVRRAPEPAVTATTRPESQREPDPPAHGPRANTGPSRRPCGTGTRRRRGPAGPPSTSRASSGGRVPRGEGPPSAP